MKKTPEQRKEAILAMLNETGKLSVDTIAEQLDVSAMTVNRDIRELAGEGKIRRMHGIVLPPDDATQSDNCALCRREVFERTQFLYLFPAGKTASYCCPHCGFAQLSATPAPITVFATDFLYSTMIDAFSATYLIGSRIDLCCQPSVLCFKNRDDALAFQQGFGGQPFTLKEAVAYLYSHSA